ncbi:serine O-acetyltransferase [Kineococcus sp. LSe6-4]|uniref:Serine O-acetyltransferase n=1 Tax=Kineococcus halophytocola TaxID=3234027 RepID=A0ABV4H8B0_9ACTN
MCLLGSRSRIMVVGVKSGYSPNTTLTSARQSNSLRPTRRDSMTVRQKWSGAGTRWREQLTQDFARNPFWESRATLGVWRLGQAVHRRPGLAATLLRRLHTVCDAVWVRGLIGAELPREIDCGAGLRLPHGGRGVILHPDTRIGAGVTLYHRVTVGVSGPGRPPVIEDGAYVGAGATIIGPVVVGPGAKIGAGAVVVDDVPGGATAVGVPAVVRRRTVVLDAEGVNSV